MRVIAPLSTAVAFALVASFVIGSRSKLPGAKTRSSPGTVQSALEVTPAQFWAVSLGAGLISYLTVYAMTSLLIVAVMPAIVVATLPRAYYGRKRAQRLIEVQQAWPDGLRDLISSVRSGASLPSAVESLATFGPPPLRDAFQGFPLYSRSLGFVSALAMIKSDLSDPTSDRVIEVLILAYERGGAVVPEILSDLAQATTKDIWVVEEIQTEVLEQKINSRVVFVLPWLVLIAMTARSGAFREFYSTRLGVTVAVVGGVMSLVGIAVASRLGKQPLEPRVLTSGRPVE
jgi:tight adherence protein B